MTSGLLYIGFSLMLLVYGIYLLLFPLLLMGKLKDIEKAIKK